MGTQNRSSCPRSQLRDDIVRALGVNIEQAERPRSVTYGRSWSRDGIDGRELHWGETDAWLLRPAAGGGVDLPAVLLMHAHDGVKFHGKEKVADGPFGPAPGIAELREHGYDRRAVASGLVTAGFAVLVHDVFPWGSRRVKWDDLPERARKAADMDPARYEAAAREHEHGVAKVAALTGSSLAGLVLGEDLAALQILRSLPGIDASRIAVSGFSGGGARVAHLLAAADVKAAVVTAMTSTFADIADGHADDTTWLMITPGLPAVCDWPDVAASAAPTPLLVQFAQRDGHFSVAGMRDADAALHRAYRAHRSLTTQWFDDEHRFTSEMQDAATKWLRQNV